MKKIKINILLNRLIQLFRVGYYNIVLNANGLYLNVNNSKITNISFSFYVYIGKKSNYIN